MRTFDRISYRVFFFFSLSFLAIDETQSTINRRRTNSHGRYTRIPTAMYRQQAWESHAFVGRRRRLMDWTGARRSRKDKSALNCCSVNRYKKKNFLKIRPLCNLVNAGRKHPVLDECFTALRSPRGIRLLTAQCGRYYWTNRVGNGIQETIIVRDKHAVRVHEITKTITQ